MKHDVVFDAVILSAALELLTIVFYVFKSRSAERHACYQANRAERAERVTRVCKQIIADVEPTHELTRTLRAESMRLLERPLLNAHDASRIGQLLGQAANRLEPVDAADAVCEVCEEPIKTGSPDMIVFGDIVMHAICAASTGCIEPAVIAAFAEDARNG